MQRFYALKNKDNKIRLTSSSGGAFYEIAKYVIQNNGVVYGAKYDDNFNVKHDRVDKIDELHVFSGSKYVQSDFSSVLKDIKKDLKNSKKVLFSGTPCQVNTVKITNKEYQSNLILVDLVCHGTPQIKFYNEYKKMLEKKYKSKIKYINMRYKKEKKFQKNLNKKKKNHYQIISEYLMFMQFENDKKYVCSSDYDPFYVLFDLFLKSGCFKCPFANLNRISDITIGDFHEFSSSLKDFNDNNGVSLLIVNTEKGKEIFDKVKENYDYIEKNEQEVLQPALTKPLNEPKNYKLFNEEYKNKGFEFVVNKYVYKNKRLQIRKFADKIGLLKLYLCIKKKYNK